MKAWPFASLRLPLVAVCQGLLWNSSPTPKVVLFQQSQRPSFWLVNISTSCKAGLRAARHPVIETEAGLMDAKFLSMSRRAVH